MEPILSMPSWWKPGKGINLQDLSPDTRRKFLVMFYESGEVKKETLLKYKICPTCFEYFTEDKCEH